MSRITVTSIIMDNGEVLKIQCSPTEAIGMLTGKDGKTRDGFVNIGADYINPKHVSLLCSGEEENKDHEKVKTNASFQKPV